MVKAKFPDSENIIEHFSKSLEIISRIEKKAEEKNKVNLDLTDVHWFLPSIILICNKIKELASKKVNITYNPPNKIKPRKYMEKIRFPLGKMEDGDSYVSVKHFKRNKKEENKMNKGVNELIESIEKKIPYEFGDSIKYILGELSDNIDEHSKFEYASLMAQYYPSKEILDIAIFDNGISIPSLFEENQIDFKDDADAIRKAVKGEVTTKKGEEMRGYGLKTCEKLSVEGLKGELYIASRNGILVLKPDEKTIPHRLKENRLQGTFIYLRLKTPKEKLDIYKYVE